MPGNIGEYNVKVYITDEVGATGYLTFKIKIVDVYVPSIRVKGLPGAARLPCSNGVSARQCTDEYIEQSVIGEDVVTMPK